MKAISISQLFICNALISLSNAQSGQILTFGNGGLPQCAQQCQNMFAAQGACVPPAVPVTNQGTYKSCFCQSAFLQSLYNTPAGLCDAACPPAGLSQIQSWFIGQCPNKGVAGQPITSTTTSTSGTTPSPDPASAASAAATSPLSIATNNPPPNWWSSHWKWVLMVIIIGLAIIGASVGGVLFKRNRRRKAIAAAAMAEPVAWGPHQHQHFTNGYTYGTGQRGSVSGSKKVKGKGRATPAESSNPRHQLRETMR
ncbi:MAG: hypothetical protein M1825_004790 [Sarcosagium campestre]|nr:MAG: hypothetical protein M1825_004790 [Sarcosagium campestre]